MLMFPVPILNIKSQWKPRLESTLNFFSNLKFLLKRKTNQWLNFFPDLAQGCLCQITSAMVFVAQINAIPENCLVLKRIEPHCQIEAESAEECELDITNKDHRKLETMEAIKFDTGSALRKQKGEGKKFTISDKKELSQESDSCFLNHFLPEYDPETMIKRNEMIQKKSAKYFQVISSTIHHSNVEKVESPSRTTNLEGTQRGDLQMKGDEYKKQQNQGSNCVYVGNCKIDDAGREERSLRSSELKEHYSTKNFPNTLSVTSLSATTSSDTSFYQNHYGQDGRDCASPSKLICSKTCIGLGTRKYDFKGEETNAKDSEDTTRSSSCISFSTPKGNDENLKSHQESSFKLNVDQERFPGPPPPNKKPDKYIKVPQCAVRCKNNANPSTTTSIYGSKNAENVEQAQIECKDDKNNVRVQSRIQKKDLNKFGRDISPSSKLQQSFVLSLQKKLEAKGRDGKEKAKSSKILPDNRVTNLVEKWSLKPKRLNPRTDMMTGNVSPNFEFYAEKNEESCSGNANQFQKGSFSLELMSKVSKE